MSAVRFPGSRESSKAVRRAVDQQPSDDNASVRSRAAARIIVPRCVNPICSFPALSRQPRNVPFRNMFCRFRVHDITDSPHFRSAKREPRSQTAQTHLRCCSSTAVILMCQHSDE